MHIVGLTGGIACGKSTVSNHLRERGIAIVDADRIAHAVLVVHTPAYEAVVDCFGTDVLDGGEYGRAVDRAVLGRIVFADKSRRQQLNGITHPYIRLEMARQVLFWIAIGRNVVVVDAPLLIESGLHKWMTSVAVVACDTAEQMKRLGNRGLSPQHAQLRIDAQMPLADKLERADVVINTDCDVKQTMKQADAFIDALPRSYTYPLIAIPAITLYALLSTVSILANALSFLKRKSRAFF